MWGSGRAGEVHTCCPRWEAESERITITNWTSPFLQAVSVEAPAVPSRSLLNIRWTGARAGAGTLGGQTRGFHRHSATGTEPKM